MMRHKSILIPVQLCEWVLKNKFAKPFQLYILLKAHCDGKMKIPKSQFAEIAAMLHRKSGKTVNNNLKKLLAANFVGYNAKSEYYFIRGIDQVRKLLNLQARTSSEFFISDIHSLQEFCLAAVASHIVKHQERKKWLSERQKWRSNQNSPSSSSALPYNHVTCSLLSKILGISIQNAFSLKQKAVKAGYIEVRKHLLPLNMAVCKKWALLKGNPEIANRVRVRDEELYLQMPDEVIPKICFKSRKKIKS